MCLGMMRWPMPNGRVNGYQPKPEWEYAARGGLVFKRYPWGDEIDKTQAHYDSWNNGNGTTKPVGSFSANGYGLYDMAGNVYEWCQDWYSSDYYSNSPALRTRRGQNGSYLECCGAVLGTINP